ncbi:MAG: GGDEF domain-containing protein, partial [Kofleriaceae bacterium]|nr:GGDEF domain-containing protein [Kofleriaceae bacterium]
PWLVQIEIHFWAVCLSISLYTVGSFTTPFSILLVGLPVFGYLLFGAAIKSGLIAMAIGTATGMVLPQLGVLPYAPFLKTAPCADGQLHPAWIGAFGMPAIFVAVIVVAMQISLMRQLHERQRELEHLSGTDVLTGLANRAAFFERLAAELARARRHGQCISMLRADDVAGRYGGEEFAMILPHTTLQQAVIVSERIRVGVHAIHIGTPTDSRAALPLSVSIGLAQHDGSETADQLVARADVALYRAKHAGRDQVAVAGTAVTVDAIDSAAS